MDLLDIIILVCKLLIVEAKLIHEVRCHLLDLVLGEGLASRTQKEGSLRAPRRAGDTHPQRHRAHGKLTAPTNTACKPCLEAGSKRARRGLGRCFSDLL